MTLCRCLVPTLLAAVLAAEDALPPPPVPPPAPAPIAPATTSDQPATAADDDASKQIVVTPDRRANQLPRTTSDVVVIDAQELADRGHPAFIGDALSGEPGVQVQRNAGGVGGLTRIRIRGAQSSDTQVLIDGIPFNDPADFSSNPDLVWLSPAGMQRIELVKGAQSGLYGSRAAGGVIEVTGPRPTADNQGFGRIEYGSFATARAEVGATGPIAGSVGYALGVEGIDSHGYSAMSDAGAGGRGDGHEADPFQRFGANGRIEAGDARTLRGYVAGATVIGRNEFDSFAGFPTFAPQPDDDQPREELRAWRGATGGTLRAREDIVFAADAAFSEYDRSYPTVVAATDTRRRDTREWYGSTRATYEGIERTALTLGVDGRRDEADIADLSGATVIDASDRLIGIWAQGLYSAPEDYELSLVVRRDEHSRDGDATTFRLGGAYFLFAERVRLQGALATGFRAPSLSELFDPNFGNPDLAAQRSEHQELGARVRVVDDLTVQSTWFATNYTQKIGFDPSTFQSINQPGARVEGIENAIEYQTRPVGILLHYTRTDSDDGTGTGAQLADTPLHRGGVSFTHHRGTAWFRVEAERVGQRVVVGTSLPPYTLAGASAGWWATRWLELYARAENLTDAKYETNPGFSTSARAAYVGLTARY